MSPCLTSCSGFIHCGNQATPKTCQWNLRILFLDMVYLVYVLDLGVLNKLLEMELCISLYHTVPAVSFIHTGQVNRCDYELQVSHTHCD